MKYMLLDDDKNILAAFKRQLEGSFDLVTHCCADKALGQLREDKEVAVIVTDLKMPRMDGLEFLAEARRLRPDVETILLTGHPDIKMAMRAVNDGHIYRFLTKPCSAVELTRALSEASAEYERNRTKHELTERTLTSCIKVLIEIFGVVDPVGAEAIAKSRKLVRPICAQLRYEREWELELAVALCDIGSYTIPSPVLIHARTQPTLEGACESLFSRLPEISYGIVSQIPRLESVAEIIRGGGEPGSVKDPTLRTGAYILRLLRNYSPIDFEQIAKGSFAEINARFSDTPNDIVIAFARAVESLREFQPEKGSRVVPLDALATGQILGRDVETKDGVRLAAKGQVLDKSLIDRIVNYAAFAGLKEEPLVEATAHAAM